MKIIVVDDETDALSNFLLHVLDSDIEYKMFSGDPFLALEYVRTNHVDAAFLDINMPKINGVELAERLIKINGAIRIVFISGYTQDEKVIRTKLGSCLSGFCYKPYSADKLFVFLRRIAAETGNSRRVFFRAFGTFELFIDDKAVKFSSTKSKELLALLADKNGSYLSMSEAITCLWPDKNAEHAKILYRDAVWRLRQSLKLAGLGGLVVFARAQLNINKNCVRCDYWDFLTGKNQNLYSGVYMSNYDWSLETQNKLDLMKL